VRVARHYLAHCDGADPFDPRSIMTYLAASANTVKRITVRNRWDSIKLLCQYGQLEGLIDRDPMFGLRRPRVTREEMERDLDPISKETVQSVLAVCPSWTWIGLRDKTIIMTLWDTPVRAGELCALKLDDIDWDGLKMKVRDGKGGCRYEVPFTHHTGLAIDRYLRMRPHKSPALFVTRDGVALHPSTLAELLRKLSQRARLKRPLFAHWFRHNYRMRLRALGLDDVDIAALMGHASVEGVSRTTWAYGRRVAQELAAVRLREKLGEV